MFDNVTHIGRHALTTIAAPTALALCLVLIACGSPGAGTSASSLGRAKSANRDYVRADDDNFHDNDDFKPGPENDDFANHNDDPGFMAAYGPLAGPADTRAIANLAARYMTAAAAADGRAACSLLDAGVRDTLTHEHAPPPARAGARTRSECPVMLAAIFRREHTRLAADRVATMAVLEVRADASLGIARLAFEAMPERDLLVARDGRAWRVAALLDGELS